MIRINNTETQKAGIKTRSDSLTYNRKKEVFSSGIGLIIIICHSSAFQIISVRSVYIRIINYSCSISANLISTMESKQHGTKNLDILGTIFVMEGFLAENVQNLQFLLIQ